MGAGIDFLITLLVFYGEKNTQIKIIIIIYKKKQLYLSFHCTNNCSVFRPKYILIIKKLIDIIIHISLVVLLTNYHFVKWYFLSFYNDKMIKDLEKCSIASLAQQWILCSEWVPSEWESKQLIKTSQVIHTTPVHQLTSWEDKSL